ncbi:MAG: DNA topoisomerase IV, partial [Candidatus Nanopelagicales bacterium]
GMTGIRLAKGAAAVFFGAVASEQPAVVVTVSGHSDAFAGTDPGSLKVTSFDEYPAKGRGTGGVRCHRLLKGEDTLLLGWVGVAPARAAAASGVPIDLPTADARRDGSGAALSQPIAAVAGAV